MYTLKLDLSQYERGALITMLSTEIARAERDGTSDSPFNAAMVKILDDIDGYVRAVEYAREITLATDRKADAATVRREA